MKVRISGALVAIIAIGAGIAPADVASAASSTPGMPRYCYHWPAETIRLDHGSDSAPGWYSDAVMVTDGSPCLDVNVKQVRTANGKSACRQLRVRWTASGDTTAWRKVCKSWRVLAYDAPEGAAYVVESRDGAAVAVVVRG
jgi:hypothetical protein